MFLILKKKIVHIFHLLGGDVNSFPLEQRLFNIMAVISVFLAFVGAYHNFVLKLHPITIYPSILGGLASFYCYCNSRIKGHYKGTYIVVLAVITMIIISIVFFNNSGSSGPILLLQLALFNVFLIVSSGKSQIIIILLQLVIVLGLYYVEYIHPEWISTYSSAKERFWDVLATFTNATIFMSVGTIIFKRSYNQERKKVSDQNKELSMLNKKIEGQKSYLEQQKVELEQSIIEIEGKNKFIYSLMKEVNHRVKNNLQLVSSLLNTQEMQAKHKDVKVALRMAKSRIISISLIHQKLYKDEMELSIELGNYIEELAEYLIYSCEDANTINLKMEPLSLQMEVEYAVHIGLVINELITNSIKHAWRKNQKERNIDLKMKYSNGLLEFIVKDNGQGFDNLNSFNQNGSIGLELVHSIVEQYDGTVQISNANGAQTKINMLVNNGSDEIRK